MFRVDYHIHCEEQNNLSTLDRTGYCTTTYLVTGCHHPTSIAHLCACVHVRARARHKHVVSSNVLAKFRLFLLNVPTPLADRVSTERRMRPRFNPPRVKRMSPKGGERKRERVG